MDLTTRACDLCKKIEAKRYRISIDEEMQDGAWELVSIAALGNERTFDLCEKCYARFVHFISRGLTPIKRRPRKQKADDAES